MKVGLCNGCFDMFHQGHGYFLKEAARQCDYLIVAVNNDASVCRLKGPERPVEKLLARMNGVDTYLYFRQSAIRYNHAVIPFDGDADALIEAIQPDVVFRGEDQQPVGTHITLPMIRIARLPGFSSTWELQRRGK